MITNAVLKEFRKDFKEAVKDLEEKYNIEIEIGNITYSDHDFRGKLTCVEKGEDGLSGNDAQLIRNHDRLCGLYNIPKDAIGKTFKHGKDEFKYLGLNEKKRKNPVILEKVSDGKRYKTTVESFLSIIGG